VHRPTTLPVIAVTLNGCLVMARPDTPAIIARGRSENAIYPRSQVEERLVSTVFLSIHLIHLTS